MKPYATIDLYVSFETNRELKNIQNLFFRDYEKIGSESTNCDKRRGHKSRKICQAQTYITVSLSLSVSQSYNIHISNATSTSVRIFEYIPFALRPHVAGYFVHYKRILLEKRSPKWIV